MVGVPRSKGCVNCRRRKVACDQQKPSCRVCLKRGDRCEGYAKYPVILQWSPNGLKKRQRFEEVAKTDESFASPPGPFPSILKKESSGSLPHEPAFPIQVDSGQVVLRQIHVCSLESYLPRTGDLATEAQNSWMWSLMTMHDLGPALGPAMTALGMSRVGTVLKNQDIIHGARVQYAVALLELQSALYDPLTAFQDRTLGAIRALSVYEIFNPTSGNKPNDRSHVDGMSQWCVAAGPQSINTDFALQIFYDVRWFLMIKAVEHRKSSILGNEDWRLIPWQNCTKDSLQQIFDVGFKLAALLEQTDTSLQILDAGDPARLAYLHATCLAIGEELELWYHLFQASRTGIHPVDESPDSLANHQLDEIPSDFDSLWQASNLIYYWGFKLILNNILISILQSVAAPTEYEDEVTIQNLTLSPNPSEYQSPMNSEGAILISPFPSQKDLATTNLQLADNIVHSAPYFLRDDMGWMGPTRLFNPLQQAAEYLNRVGSPLYVEARAALMRLYIRVRSK